MNSNPSSTKADSGHLTSAATKTVVVDPATHSGEARTTDTSKKKTATEAQLKAWIAAGETTGDIAKRLGRARSNILATVAVLGLFPARREGCATSYLAGLAEGKTLREIAHEYGTHIANVQMTLRRAGLPTCAREYLRRQVLAARGVSHE